MSLLPRFHLFVICLISGLLPGCGGSPEKEATAPRSGSPQRVQPARPAAVQTPRQDATKSESPPPKEREQQRSAPRGSALPSRTLADLLDQPADSASRMLPHLPQRTIDDARAAAAGIRKLDGRRLTLYTDLTGPEIDRLPELFDQAFPQWCDYFHVDPDRHADWKMTGFLMKDRKTFSQTDLLPGDLPPFRHGFSRNYELWLDEQPTEYYRRHLLLHEGTHGFMNTTLGGCGPMWYMEGMAELLATHSFRDGKLRLNWFPPRREETPGWGRIRTIQDAFAVSRAKSLDMVLAIPPFALQDEAGYAWVWAAAALMDGHPRYQVRFRQLRQHVLDPDFQRKFDELFAADRPELFEEWQVFVAGLEYGNDVPRMAIDFQPGKNLPVQGADVSVAADRGWQNSGCRLEAGRTYKLIASGRWEKRCRPEFWPGLNHVPEKITLEPGGISIRYYRGRPLGQLLAAVRPDKANPNHLSVFLNPIVVGLSAEITPKQSGTLYLRLNDSAAELRDNKGEIRVEIKGK
jgi:hypothetical protein